MVNGESSVGVAACVAVGSGIGSSVGVAVAGTGVLGGEVTCRVAVAPVGVLPAASSGVGVAVTVGADVRRNQNVGKPYC
jgi:hypothetical protein